MKIETNPIIKPVNSYNIISIVFLFFSFFPYLKILETGSDLQPLSFFIGIFYLIIKLETIKFNKLSYFILLTLIFIFSFFLVGIISNIEVIYFRGLYSYASILLHSVVSYDILKKRPALIAKTVEVTIYVWFIVGFIQNYIYPSFLTFLLSRGSAYDAEAAGGRGVISLAVEPTFYGIQCFFLLLFVILIKNATDYYSKKKSYLLIVLCILQILVLARSSMVILFLLLTLVTLIVTSVFKKPLYALIALVFITGAIFLSISFINKESRMYSLASIFIESPENILMLDRSINERISDIYYSIKGFLSNPFGHGLNGWQDYLQSQPNSKVFVKTEQPRIMSFLGSFLFEGGIFSFFLIFYIYKNLNAFLRNINCNGLAWYCLSFLILLTAIQSSYPPVWILFTSSLILLKDGKAHLNYIPSKI